MKTLIKQFTVYAAIAMMLVASSAYAMPMGEGKGEKKDHAEKFQEIIDQLDLSEEQREELKTRHQEQKTEMKALKEKLTADRKTLHEELKKYDSDKGVIKSTIAKISFLQTQLMEKRTESFLAMKELLTREQFEKMNKIMDEKRAEWQKKKQNRKKGGPGQGGPGGPKQGGPRQGQGMSF